MVYISRHVYAHSHTIHILFQVYNGGMYSLSSRSEGLGMERSGTSETDLQIFSVFCNIV